MTNAEAIMQLAALTQRSRAAADAQTANDVLAQARAIVQDPTLAPTRELAAALINVAGATVAAGAPAQVEALFGEAQRVLNASSDAQIDDQLMIWHNLGVLYEKHGAHELRDQVHALIGQVAARYEGPLLAHGAGVLLEQAMGWRRLGRIEPMMVLLRQVHRYRTGADQPPEERVSWLEIYASLLLDAGRSDEALPVLAQGIALAQELGQPQREVSLLLTSTRAAHERNDDTAVLAALERARKLVEQPPLATTRLGASVWLNLAAALLRQRAADRYIEARGLCERAIDVLRVSGSAEGDDLGYALYHHAVLIEYLGDWHGAAREYLAAAAVPGVDPAAVTEWRSLAGRAWYEAGEFDAASDCYLDTVRRRVAT